MSTLYSKIKSYLELKRKTFSWLANEINYSRQGLKNSLLNKSVKIEVLEKISELLDVSPSVFFDNKYKELDLIELDKDFLLTLSNRYDGYLDKISFFKDYYVWKILLFVMDANPVLGQGLPAFTFRYKGSPEFLITPEQAEELKTLIEFEPYKGIPYSKMPGTRQNFIKTTNILWGFYFLLFRDDVLNIRSLLTDGLIKDSEVNKYWKRWKAIQ